MPIAIRYGFEAIIAIGLLVSAVHARPFAAYVMLIAGFALIVDILGNCCANTGGGDGLRNYKL